MKENMKEKIMNFVKNKKNLSICGGVLASIVALIIVIVLVSSKSNKDDINNSTTLNANADEKTSISKEDETTLAETTEIPTTTQVQTTQPQATTKVQATTVQATTQQPTSTPSTEAPASKPETTPVTDSPIYNQEESTPSFDDQMESLGYILKDGCYQKPYTFAGKPAIKYTCDNSTFHYVVSLGGGYSFGSTAAGFSLYNYVTYSEDFVLTYYKGTSNFMGIIKEFYVFDSLPIPWDCSEDEYISTLVKCCPLDLSVLELELRLFYRAYNVIMSASPEEEGYDYLYKSIMGGSVKLSREFSF